MHEDAVSIITRIKDLLISDSMKENKSFTKLCAHLREILQPRLRSKMFNIVDTSWNPITGCLHWCQYCWARDVALNSSYFKRSRRYSDGFVPQINNDVFRMKFKRGVIFVCDMGDIFSPEVQSSWIQRVFNHISNFPNTYFLFLTKNPSRFKEFLDKVPHNAILGTTLETNKDDLYAEYHISGAPLPSERYMAMKEIDWPLKFVSIEPILDFDLETFVGWIKEIKPFLVYVGYDNHEWRLPEPPLEKTRNLIRELKKFTCVIEKTIRESWKKYNLEIGKSKYTGNYENFKQYLNLMHERAAQIIEMFRDRDRELQQLDELLKEGEQAEHYWTLKKLFSLAMYIPMFLLIGRSSFEKGHCDGLIYIDTHAGPGLAKVGKERQEIVLGSPLLALYWPTIIGNRLKTFKKIEKGFDKLFFIEKDRQTCIILKQLVDAMGDGGNLDNVEIFCNDSNKQLYEVREKIIKNYKKPLILMFVDPFGRLDDQIKYNVFLKFTRGLRVDLIMNINASMLTRGLIEIRRHNYEGFIEAVKQLWGDLYKAPRSGTLSKIFEYCKHELQFTDANIHSEDVLYAYLAAIKSVGYRCVEHIPVKFDQRLMYYLVFASKSSGSYEWLRNYVEYLRTKTPEDYETLKNLWLQAYGRVKSLLEFKDHLEVA